MNIYPPFELLFKIVRDFPTSALLYMQIWQKRGASNLITVHKKNVRSQYLMELPKFRRDLTYLGKGEFITWMEDKNGTFYIELPEVQIDGKDNCLC